MSIATAQNRSRHRYLSLLVRQRIAALHFQGFSVREIARRLARSASTVRSGGHQLLVMVTGYSRMISAVMIPSRQSADLIAGPR